jgi:hypothetical protein
MAKKIRWDNDQALFHIGEDLTAEAKVIDDLALCLRVGGNDIVIPWEHVTVFVDDKKVKSWGGKRSVRVHWPDGTETS